MGTIRTIASIVALVATLTTGVTSSLAAVNYSITFEFSLNASSPTLSGETFTFSKSVPDFLSVDGSLTYDLITQISTTSGAVATYPDQLVLTQNAVGITSDAAAVTFNPPLGTLFGGATAIAFNPIGTPNPPGSACLPDTSCNQTGSVIGAVTFASPVFTDPNRIGSYVLVVSGTPDNGSGVVPEPASLLLCATGLAGLAARRLRRRARRTRDLGQND